MIAKTPRGFRHAAVACRVTFALACGVTVVASAGCRRRHDTGGAEGAAPSTGASAGRDPSNDAVLTAPLGPLKWTPFTDLGSLGVPAGCTVVPPVQQAALPKGNVRFVAPAGAPSELLVAVDEDGDGNVDRSGLLDARGEPGTHGTRWRHLEAPPQFARSSGGLLAFDTEDTGSRRRASLFRESGAVEKLAEGDRLEIVDALCSGAKCAVLTTFASASAGPGATVFIGDASKPATSWARVDLPGEGENASPFSLVRLDGNTVWVALTTEEAISVTRIENGVSTRVGRMATAFGAYDVVLGNVPIALCPGETVDENCNRDGFVVRLLAASGRSFDIEGHVPPTNVVTRPLQDGFFAGWLSPISCKQHGRNMVRAFLVDSDGAPASSTMAVGEANGFAVSTHADQVDLWMSTSASGSSALVWVKARCTVPPPPAKPRPSP